VLTLEELAQRLDELELHVLQQSSDVVVRLDGRARALEADRLDDVRVQRSLQQPLDLALGLSALLRELLLRRSLDLGRLGLEHLDEGVSDDLPLSLRVLDARQSAQEQVRGVDDGEVHAELGREHLVHLLALVLSEHTVVNHDRVESGVRRCTLEAGSRLTGHR